MSELNETPKQLSIKEAIQQELIRCKQDPVYFCKKYYMIQHPTKGRVHFNLYPFQESVLRLFLKNKFSIVNKSRQLGISTLSSAYALWLMLFHTDKNVLCIATKTETAKNMVTKVKFGYDSLPSWMKIKSVENNKLSIRLANGSQMKAVSAAGDSARSEAVSLLLIDEAAFIDNIEEVFVSAQQTLATGGGCIAVPTNQRGAAISASELYPSTDSRIISIVDNYGKPTQPFVSYLISTDSTSNIKSTNDFTTSTNFNLIS